MLSELDDYTLLHIFEFLPLKDQFQLTGTCQRFQHLIVKYIFSKSNECTHVSTQGKLLRDLNVEDYKRFFEINAENIRELKVENSGDYFKKAAMHERPSFSYHLDLKLPNLEKFLFPCMNEEVMEKMSQNYPKVEYVRFYKGEICKRYLLKMPKLQRIGMEEDIEFPVIDDEYASADGAGFYAIRCFNSEHFTLAFRMPKVTIPDVTTTN